MGDETVVDALEALHEEIVRATDLLNSIRYTVGRKLGDEPGKLPKGLDKKIAAQTSRVKTVADDLEAARAEVQK